MIVIHGAQKAQTVVLSRRNRGRLYRGSAETVDHTSHLRNYDHETITDLLSDRRIEPSARREIVGDNRRARVIYIQIS